MFCLMDASASMTEPLKDLAKRFFMLLHVFLSKHYREVDVVFIRHTSTASEVDEETFFRGVETGGTVISTALDEMDRIVRDRYSPEDWNIYAAQASDGDNIPDDMGRCIELVEKHLLPASQYFAYIEVCERPGARRDHRLARLQGSGRPQQAFRHAPGVQSGRDLPRVPRAVLQLGRIG